MIKLQKDSTFKECSAIKGFGSVIFIKDDGKAFGTHSEVTHELY